MEEPLDSFVPTERTRVRRLHERGHDDRETVYAILDAGFICTIGYVIDGQPCGGPAPPGADSGGNAFAGACAKQQKRATS